MAEEVFDDTLVSQGNLDLDSFTDEISRLLKKAWGEDWGTFQLDEVMGDDPEITDIPIIAYDYESRKRSTSHPSLDPVLFDSFTDDERSQAVKLYRQWFDVCMVFKIYHTTNKQAMELMADLEAFLFTYKGHLKKLGLSDIVFMEERKPQVRKDWNKHIVQRELVYAVRIERITEQRSNLSKNISYVDTDRTNNQMFGGSAILNHVQSTRKIQ